MHATHAAAAAMHVLPQLQFSLSHIWSSRYPIYKYRPNPHYHFFFSPASRTISTLRTPLDPHPILVSILSAHLPHYILPDHSPYYHGIFF